MPELRKVTFNPADHSQGYKLWSNGTIEPIGTAPLPDTDYPDDWAVSNPVIDLNVINWAEPSGYTLTDDGEIRGFGAVVDPGVHGHLPTVNFRIWKRMFMNPNGDGSGYMFAFNGTYNRWGPTAPALGAAVPPVLPGPTPDYGRDYVRDVALDWATKKWIILGKTGEMHASFSIAGYTSVVPVNQYDWDVYRSLLVRDWNTATPKVLVGSMSGWLYAVNSWGSFRGQPVTWFGRDVMADLHLIHDGSGGQPMEIAMASRQGGVWRWFVSSPPTTVWVEPANGSTVTTTTRPVIRVGWIDPDGNSVVTTDVRVYGPNLGSITDPDVAGVEPKMRWLNEPLTTGYDSYIDLANGTWQGFVKVTDSAGQSSTWAKSTWTQNVTLPATPTVSVPVIVGTATRFTVTGSTDATKFVFAEYSDDDGATWFPVRNFYPGPSIDAAGVYVYDYEAPFNTDRKYRAMISSLSPRLASLWSATVTGRLPGQFWMLQRVEDGSEIRLRVAPDVQKPDPVDAGVFTPLKGAESIVLSAGVRQGPLKAKLRVLSKDERLELYTYLRYTGTMLLRNPFGGTWFVKVTDSVSPDILRSVPLLNEDTPLRDAHEVSVTFTPVRRPWP